MFEFMDATDWNPRLHRREVIAHPTERVLQIGIGSLGSLNSKPFFAGNLEIMDHSRHRGGGRFRRCARLGALAAQ